MRHSRAMTLVEVLAAVVLLAVLATAIASAMRSIGQRPSALDANDEVDFADLQMAADIIAADPLTFGAETIESDETPRTLAIDLDEAQSIEVSVRVIHSLSPDTDHCWIAIASGDQFVIRFLALQESEGPVR